MIDGDFAPEAKLAQHLKDVRLILEAGEWPARSCRSVSFTNSCSPNSGARPRRAATTAASSARSSGRRRAVIYRTLGRTGLRVSAVSFGAGPVSGLMTGHDHDAQLATVGPRDRGRHQLVRHRRGIRRRAIGSEPRSRALRAPARTKFTSPRRFAFRLEALDQHRRVHPPVGDESLERLRVHALRCSRLHNGITLERGDEPASITPADVLGPVAEAFRRLQDEGLVQSPRTDRDGTMPRR